MRYRYHHFHVICSDLEQMENFFTKMFGAKVVERRKFGTADGALLDLDGVNIFLRTARDNDNVIGDSSQARYGYDHLGLAVEDLDAAYRELTEKGVTFSISPVDIDIGRMAFLKGPDGITIELYQESRSLDG